ncbi:glycoside hydrolase family 51 protein [Mycena olivaceomarginata]|nr:glycoside hydrolase family 51 protein [Mycena olivaceomarginata]
MAPSIHVDPARHVDPQIYSGFTEHMGRCMYSGLNFVSSYRWQGAHNISASLSVATIINSLHGIGPKELHSRGPELAWLTEASNQFKTEPYICLNMGTGTLEDGLARLEYCNTFVERTEPYVVKYWALGNKTWGRGKSARLLREYGKKAFQWAKALRLLDPSIKLVSCGETGFAYWDRVTLKTLALVIHPIPHTRPGSSPHHLVSTLTNLAYQSAAAEKGIEITKSLVELAKIECFDEWNVWDPVRGVADAGTLLSHSMLPNEAVASWLNVFVRKADVVKIACIAQSVNVISPGTALSLHVTFNNNNKYTNPTVPAFVASLTAHTPPASRLTKWIDASGVLSPNGTQVRLAIVNRHQTRAYSVPKGAGKVVVHQSADLRDRNAFAEGEKVKSVETAMDDWKGVHEVKHSFQARSVFLIARGFSVGLYFGLLSSTEISTNTS